jgi:hypothetical protein
VKVTRIAYSHRLNPGKYAALAEQSRRLGRVRSQVWQRYASVSGAGLRDRQVRDGWLAAGTHEQFGVLANAWKETVRDAMADITANAASAKAEVKRAIRRHTSDPAELKRLYTALKADRWADDAYLSRQMRRHRKRGHNRTHNKAKGRARARLRSIANNAAQRGDHGKADRVHRNNLGTIKRERRRARWESQVRTETFTAVHRVVDKAAVVVAEDLTKTFVGRRPLSKNTNRRLAAWTKGVTAEALTNVSQRRGSALVHVNAAYTSQTCHHCGYLGKRSGDRFHCTRCGVVWQADVNAAINVLQRHGDSDIALHTPHRVVKQIVQARAYRHRTRLPVPDSSGPRSAESETSINTHAQV